MAEERPGEAELGMLKNSTTFLPPTHTLLLPWLHTGEHLRIGVSPYHYCWCWQTLGSHPSWSSCMHLSYLRQFFSPSLKPIPSSCEHIDLQSCTDSSQALWCFCLQASPSHYFCIGHPVLTADTNHTFYKSISKAFSLE